MSDPAVIEFLNALGRAMSDAHEDERADTAERVAPCTEPQCIRVRHDGGHTIDEETA